MLEVETRLEAAEVERMDTGKIHAGGVVAGAWPLILLRQVRRARSEDDSHPSGLMFPGHREPCTGVFMA